MDGVLLVTPPRLRYHVGLLGGARRILGLAHASALHQHIILTGQCHRAERDDQEQVGYIGLRTLAPHYVALRGSEEEDKLFKFKLK